TNGTSATLYTLSEVISCMAVPTYTYFFSSRRRHTRSKRDWSSDVCSSDLLPVQLQEKLERHSFLLVVQTSLKCSSELGLHVEEIYSKTRKRMHLVSFSLMKLMQ